MVRPPGAVWTLCLVAGWSWAASGVALSRDRQALMSVIVSPAASAATRAVATDLAHYLSLLSGADFQVEPGDGSRGLVVGRPAEFGALPFAVAFADGPLDREDYLLRAAPTGLYLLGASDLAVSHAVWDLLYRLGYRQFFPGPTWECLPAPRDLAIAVDERCRPAFHARRIWYNWGLWGYNDQPYRQWCARNRCIKGFDLNSGHAYEALIAAQRAEFDRHPEYLALVGGQRRTRGGDLKFCIANAGLRQLVAAHAVAWFQQHPAADSLSLEPSDGDNWCECGECARLGRVSNRVVILANEAAEALGRAGFGAKRIGLYAYNRHSAPPTVRVHPQVIVSATTAFIRDGFSFDQVVGGWQAQGATVGVYDYLSVVDWDWNLPRGAKGSRPREVAESLVKFHRQGARFYDAESGDCWGPAGLGYYTAARVLWDPAEAQRVDALREDFLTRAFGPAAEPMREFYRLLNVDTERRSPDDLLGRLFRQLAAARPLTTDARIQARLGDLLLYVRYAELYYAFAAGRGSRDDVARHAWRMRRTMLVHSYGLWCRLLDQRAALDPRHPLKDDRPFDRVELARLLADGVAHHEPVETGFVGVTYSQRLVPATPLHLPTVPTGSFPTHPQDHQSYWLWVPEGDGRLTLTVRVQKVWANRLPKLSLFSPLHVTTDPLATDESYRPDGQERTLTLSTPYRGLHRLEAVDGGDYTRLRWPAGLPVTIESGIDTPGVTSHFRGPWSLCFYVPRGTRVVGGWASRIANWAPKVSGKLLDGDGHEVHDFGQGTDGWFKVPVAPGQDGRLWRFVDSQGQRLLMTVPPYLARNGEELLLPEEVVRGGQH